MREQGLVSVLLASPSELLTQMSILPRERVPRQETFIWGKQNSGCHFTANPLAPCIKQGRRGLLYLIAVLFIWSATQKLPWHRNSLCTCQQLCGDMGHRFGGQNKDRYV